MTPQATGVRAPGNVGPFRVSRVSRLVAAGEAIRNIDAASARIACGASGVDSPRVVPASTKSAEKASSRALEPRIQSPASNGSNAVRRLARHYASQTEPTMSERPETRPEQVSSNLSSGSTTTEPARGLPVASRVERMHQRARELREAGLQPERLDPIERARRNPTSLRLAINAKCFDCGGRDADPSWRARVTECAIPACALFPVRPFQRSGEATEAAE